MLPTVILSAGLPPALSPISLVPLPGEIVLQWTQCGKACCRCTHGQKHGPYFYRIWREGARVEKMYVKAKEIDRVRLQIAVYQEMRAQLRKLTEERRSLSKKLAAQYALHRKQRRAAALSQARREAALGQM